MLGVAGVRRMVYGSVALACALTWIGCGGPTAIARADVICDGASELKLRVFVEPQNGRELRGSVVRVENGYPSLMVDGSCAYWIGGGWIEDSLGRDLDWRRGQLDTSLEQALERAIPISRLADLGDCQSSAGIFDKSARSFRGVTSMASCIQGGPRFEAAWSFIQAHAADLWNQAVPLDQGLRVEAVISGGDDSKTYPWPVSEALSAFVLPDGNGINASGVSRLIADVAAAQQLRQLREQYFSDRRAAPGLFYDGQKMGDQNTTALVYMRDQLPYEDSQGLLPFSDPP